LALGWVAVGLLFAGALLSLYLVQVSSVANAGYDIERLEEERQTWLARNQQLEVELARRHSLLWTEAEAVQRLGMVRAEAPKFLAVASTPGQTEAAPGLGGNARVGSGRARREIAVSPLDAVRPWLDDLVSQRQ
jgi:hypothetical protein